jgi:PKD repeat protein
MRKLLFNQWVFAAALLLLVFSCSDDQPAPEKAIASFQFAVDAAQFNKVTFTDFSQNAVSLSWNFDDGTALSIEENPVHVFATEGTYTVALTATGAGGDTSVKELEVTITDPNVELKKLTGLTSKSWKMIRDVSTGYYPFEVGPADRSQIWYALGINENLGKRPCLLNDEYIFSLDGDYEYKTNGDFWAEGGVWKESIGAGCHDTNDANYRNVDDVDISDWSDGVHSFEYNVAAKTITVIGSGAFIGLTKVATDSEVKVPQTSVTYKVIKLVDSTVDTLILETTVPVPGYWRFALVHYDNPLEEPEIPALPPPAGSIDAVSFDFETAGTPTWSTFGGAGAPARIANPHSTGINTSGFVAQIDQAAGIEGWAGISTDLSGKIDFTNKHTIKVKVYSPSIGAVVKLKLEEIGNSGNNKEIDMTTTAANAWEELTYTFTADDANKWDKFVLFFDFQGAAKANATTFLFDDIILE